MTRLARIVSAFSLIAVMASAALITPASVLAQGPTFGEPVGSAPMGQPLTVTSSIDGVNGGTVELLVRLAGTEPSIVIPATPGTVAGGWQATAEIDVATSYECTCHFDGTSTPNTKIEFQFRVRDADGTATLGPIGQVTVEDDRFEWRTLEQDLVRVHWYEGDDAFAQRRADVANKAIDDAAALLGTTLPEPVDLFVYATQQAMLDAVNAPRESIAGEAHSTIDTMYVWIASTDDPTQSDVTVAHELTHLVFNETTQNPYHEPPRWLNEGIATYLSEGNSDFYRNFVNVGVSTNTLIPLEGLTGLFPSPTDQFYLAYAESVSAVDYFVRTYTEQTLWDLVRSYANGLSDDDAFTAATGADMTAFNAAWTQSLSGQVREPVGPQPAPPGPVPSAWSGGAQPSFEPGSTPVPGSTQVPGQTDGPIATPIPPTPGSTDSGSGGVLVGIGLFAFVVLGVVGLVLVVQRNRTKTPPQPPMPPVGPPQY